MDEKREGMLSPYRVLDLTDEKGLLCGKLLGDLGADVIKIEKPGGDPARSVGPFYHDEVDPEKSLFWFAFNTSKRGITLDIETAAGQKTFKRLVETADFVIESFPPGYLDKLGLGYSALEKLNPGVIMVSITPFGQTGPYRDYKASDIVAWAMGGQMYQWGDTDRPPIRISHHSQTYLHAGASATVGALIALQHRRMTGEGQQVDVSIQHTIVRTLWGIIPQWDVNKIAWRRGIGTPMGAPTPFRATGAAMGGARVCKDGYVSGAGFQAVGRPELRGTPPLVDWLEEEGAADDFLRGMNWATFRTATAPPEVVAHLNNLVAKFFATRTKAELLEGAVKHRVQFSPLSTTKDVLESVQLAAREFWVEVAHPELETTITYPGAFTKASKAPPRIWRRAPLIGEHNKEVLEKELALSREELQALKQAKGYPANLNQKSQRENLEKKALAGVRVVEFGWWVAGPQVNEVLADYGAEVIKIEGRSVPDGWRLTCAKDNISGINRGVGFAQDNNGKLSVTLNLAHPKGVEIAKRFVAKADIVFQSFAGGSIDRMGLGYEELKKVKPDIIMVSTCGQGQTGPYSKQPGMGGSWPAQAGLTYITGWPDREPGMPIPYSDYIAPHFSGMTIMAALDYRRRTGKGQYLDLAQTENSVHFNAPLILDYVVNRRIADRMGNRYPYAAPHNAYRCRGEERWCAIAIFTDGEWQSFRKVIGSPAWSKSPKFRTLPARKKNEEELDRLVEEWTINHSAEEVMSLMQAAGVAAGVVQTTEDLMEHDPQLRHRHAFYPLDHPEIGKYRPITPSFVLSKLPCEVRRAPLLGEHNDYALKQILGMSDEEIAELVKEGVIE